MQIKLQQWNVWYKENVDSIVKQLKQDDADIICMQELYEDAPHVIADQLGYNYYHKSLPIVGSDGQKETIANGIYSRFPILSSRYVWINESRGDGGYSDEYRAYVEAVLDVNGHQLTIATTHMSYIHRFEATAAKRQETDKLLAEIDKQTTDFIFCGDLNALPGSYTIKALEARLQHADPLLSEPTWTTKPFSYNGFEARELEYRLDYIFTTRDIVMSTTEVINTPYSDHLPIISIFEVSQ